MERIELTGRDEKLEYLELLPHAMYLSADDKMPAVPYVDVFDGDIAWVPPILLGSICGSNGLAAGNTMEEALVQALSEIFERHAQNQIATRRLTPPLIPNAYLELAGTRETIEDIEREGRYRVSMFDCSLGLGYPVVASLIVDRFRGTFGFRFGSHPSMAVAMERTLTEAYQGRTAEQSGSANRIGPYEEVTRLDNLKNLLLNGGGAYPGELLAGTPDWEFTPWGDGEDMGNKGFLSYMLGLLKRDGFKVFIRDNSHLGFPAYSVVVPGMGEVVSQSLREKRRSMVLMHALGSFPNITPEEEALLQELAADATDRKGVTLDGLFARPLDGGAMLPARVFGFLQLKHEEFEAASTWFDILSASSSQPVAAFFWDAMAHYARVRSWGLNREDALALVERLYPRALFRRIVAYTEPEGIMERHFPRMRCRDTYECAGCPTLDEGICNGPAELDLFERIRRAVGTSDVKQTELAEALAPYVSR